jgi:hypothetical protein
MILHFLVCLCSVGGAITHSLIWMLTMYKNYATYKQEHAMSPLLQLVFRDGAAVFMIMACKFFLRCFECV